MKKIVLTLCAWLLLAGIADASQVYINPGHGAWSGSDRPLGTVRWPLLASGMPDTLGFFESNTNLWKGLYLRDKLEAAGMTVTMSRTDNGVGRNKDLDVIAAEAEDCGASYFISIHSNASQEPDPNMSNWPAFYYHSGEGGERGQSHTMAMSSIKEWLKIWTTDLNALDKLEYCSYSKHMDGNIIGDNGQYGVLWTSVPGFMAEAYFHTYRPSRHRALNPDRCCVEGVAYARAVKEWFHMPADTNGYIIGVVANAAVNSTQSLYLPTRTGWNAKEPLEGVKILLRSATTGEAVKGITCYPYVARKLVNQTYYTTDNNYNGVFVFKEIKPDAYYMDFLKDGFADTTVKVVVEANKTTCSIVLMQPGQSSGEFPVPTIAKVRYELNGGYFEGGLVPDSVIKQNYTIPVPVKQGMYFKGWYWTPDFSGSAVTVLTPGTDGTLYAKWSNTIEMVHYVLNGGSFAPGVVPDSIIRSEYTVPVPIKQGMYFFGWYWNPDFSGAEVKTLQPLADGTLYAKWNDMPLALNPYASALTLNNVVANQATVSYFLNDTVAALDFLLYFNGNLMATIPMTDPDGLSAGSHTAIVDLNGQPGGYYTWALRATGDEVDAPRHVTDNQPKFNFYWGQGVAVDNNLNSPYFGNIYVTESWGGQDIDNGRKSRQGLYIFAPDLTTDGQVYVGKFNGTPISWTEDPSADGNGFYKATHGPMRICVDEAGYVYVNDDGRWTGQNNSFVARMDPADPNGNWQNMLDTRKRETGTTANMYTRANCVAVTGNGDDRVMYIVDWSDDIVSYAVGNRVNLSTGRTVFANLPAEQFSQIPERTLVADPVKGGFWMFNYNGETGSKAAFCHFSAAGVCDFRVARGTDGITDIYNGGGAVSPDGSKIAFCDGKCIRVYQVGYRGTTPMIQLLYKIDGITSASGMAFDVADNLYFVSPSMHYFMAYALPRTDNTFTTAAPDDIANRITLSSGTGWAEVQQQESLVQKVLRNARILIRRGTEWFDMLGQKIF